MYSAILEKIANECYSLPVGFFESYIGWCKDHGTEPWSDSSLFQNHLNDCILASSKYPSQPPAVKTPSELMVSGNERKIFRFGAHERVGSVVRPLQSAGDLVRYTGFEISPMIRTNKKAKLDAPERHDQL